jgi:hypothetical protein
MDQSATNPATLGRIRLAYRNWAAEVNPAANEAVIAEQFLQALLARYVPAADAPLVRQAFWAARRASFSAGGTRTRTGAEKGPGWVQHWLEIELPERNVAYAPWPTRAITPSSAGLLSEPETLPTLPAVITPQIPLQVPLHAPASPLRGAMPQTLVDRLGTMLGVTLAPSATEPLPIPVNPATLNTAPAPESLVKPTPPPVVSVTLVPSAEALSSGRAPAPSNFSVYTEAERLTRDIEQRAMQNNMNVSPSLVAPIAMPPSTTIENAAATLTSPTQPQTPTPATPPAATEPRFTPNRALPQLRFIPKAEPLDTTGDVIRFEDEGSGL